jgi:photosystem II stability/assembly factor-like uncharacterized protein
MTSNGGLTWRRLAAPATSLEPADFAGIVRSGVSQIDFANARDGWLSGPELWGTHDGGQHWARVPVKHAILSVVSSGGWAYAAELGTPPLLRSPVGRDDWQPVQVAAGGIWITDAGPLLATSGGAAWADLTSQLPGPGIQLWRGVGGSRWLQFDDACLSPLALAAMSANDLLMICISASGGSVIMTSTDGGRQMQTVALSGDTNPVQGPVAAPLGQTTTVLTASPAVSLVKQPPTTGQAKASSSLARTTNDGRSWTDTTYTDHGVGWASLEFVSRTVGWVVHGYPGAGIDQLLRTSNAGETFTTVRF